MHIDWNFKTLDDLGPLIWRALERAACEMGHPWRTPVLGTVTDGECVLRTVVLRAANAESRHLICFTDARAAKVSHIRNNPRVQFLFYDEADKVQIRVEGRATIQHRNDLAQKYWDALPDQQRGQYVSHCAPGTKLVLADAASGAKAPDLARGFENFAVVETAASLVDFFQITPAGNRRAELRWAAGECEALWLAP